MGVGGEGDDGAGGIGGGEQGLSLAPLPGVVHKQRGSALPDGNPPPALRHTGRFSSFSPRSFHPSSSTVDLFDARCATLRSTAADSANSDD